MTTWLALGLAAVFACGSGVQTSVSNTVTGRVTGVVWNDLNANGIRDLDEPGLSGVLSVYCSTTGQVVPPDANGVYTLNGVPSGACTVSLFPSVSSEAWFQTCPSGSTQNPPLYSWTKVFQAWPGSAAECIVLDTDDEGDILCGGHFAGTVDFDPSAGVDLRTSKGGQDLFVARLDKGGQRRWVRTLGGSGADSIGDMQADPVGNVVVAGGFCGAVDFDPGDSQDLRTALGRSDGFVLRLRGDGTYDRVWTLGGQEGQVNISGLCLDGAGNIYVTGDFSGTVDFAPDPWQDDLTSASSGYPYAFLTRLNADGSYGWTRTMGGIMETYGVRVRADAQGWISLAGRYKAAGPQSIDFDPGLGRDYRDSSGDYDVFLSRFDAGGNYLWTRTFGGSGWDWPYDLRMDASGGVCMAGMFAQWVDFDPGDGIADRHTAHDHAGAWFVTRLDENGRYDWATTDGRYEWATTGGNEKWYSSGVATALDPLGYSYVLGEQVLAGYPAGVARSGLLLMQLDPYGRVVWTQDWASIVDGSIEESDDRFDPKFWGLALARNGSLVLSGRFTGAVDMDPGPGQDMRVGGGGTDAFVTKLMFQRGVHRVTVEPGSTVAGIDFGNTQTLPD